VSVRKKSLSTKSTRGTSTRPLKRNRHSINKSAEIENAVKEGVERFILKDSTIADFMKTIRAASKKEYVYSHQLNKNRFQAIVKKAIQKRNRRLTNEKHAPSVVVR
jgi:DNA-binding NarL/FixJ family response regulator